MPILLEKIDWGVFEGKNTHLYRISDEKSGFFVEISDFGATLVRVKAPDKNGNCDDVNFGQNSAQDFKEKGMFLGAMVGRVANRIENAKFTLEGKEYKIFVNNANLHSLHGGKESFSYKMWSCEKAEIIENTATLIFSYISPDGEENYPGNLKTTITYTISTEPNIISWEFEATTDKTTIINLTNHAYWNMESLKTSIDDQILTVYSDKYMLGDENNMVTGEINDVSEDNIDLRNGKRFKDIFNEFGDVDNNFFLSKYDEKESDKLNLAAELYSEKTGRLMQVYTTEPCIQVYSGNYMANNTSFGIETKKHSAVCLETQKVPNAINIVQFKNSVILKPDDIYKHKTTHKFLIK